MRSLPMIPTRFGIKLISDRGIEKQFGIIESLMSNAEAVINCGDAGQEGELIQRWVMQKAACKCPVYRLWISSLTEEAIREGFQNLKPQTEFDSLYFAGLSRAIGDWLLGMDATRLYTLKYGQNRQVLSIGEGTDSHFGINRKPSTRNRTFCSSTLLGIENLISGNDIRRHQREISNRSRGKRISTKNRGIPLHGYRYNDQTRKRSATEIIRLNQPSSRV